MQWTHQQARAASWALIVTTTLAACTPAASPPPVAPPPTSAPAAPAAPAPKDAVAPAWQSIWNQTVEAAKKEKLVIVTMPGENDKKLLAMFQEAYPGITVEHTGARPSDVSPKIVSEQQNGVFAWDVMASTGASNMHEVLLPANAFQDLPPFIINPDVTDDSKWGSGKAAFFSSRTRPQIWVHDLSQRNGLYVNRDVIPTTELSDLDTLLDPKFRGKIVVDDCTVAAQGTSALIGIWQAKGGDYVRKLLTDQKPVFQETVRVTSEWVATGRYPIAVGAADQELARLQKEGIGAKVEPMPYGGGNVSASGTAVFANAPHPNAAKVFINWFLSREGQVAWNTAHNNPPPRNSRRLDVTPNDPSGIPDYTKLDQFFIWGTDTGTEIVKTITGLCKEVRP